MASSKNKDALARAFLRFGRAAIASALALIIPALLDLIPQLELGAEFRLFAAGLIAPALLGLDKFLRSRGAY